ADNSASASGAAYVFVRSGTTWSQQAYLKASNTEANDIFGHSVAVSNDTVVVGAYEDSSATGVNGDQGDNSAATAGAAYVFARSGTTWTQQAYLKASNTDAGDVFGVRVAASGDTVIIGAMGESSSATGVNGDQTDNLASDSGAVYVFVRSEGTWSQQAYLKASNTEAGDNFSQIAVSGDTVIVGASGEDSNATGVNGIQSNNEAAGSGAAYVFVRSGTTWSQQAYLKASNTDAGDQFGNSVAVFGDTVVVGTPGECSSATGVSGNQTDNSVGNSGATYVFDAPSMFTLFASAVNGSTVGAGDYDAGSTATLAAAPNPGFVFTGWTGDATGTDNPLSVLMDANKIVNATFAPDTNDDDRDGLTNYQEIVEYGTNPTLPDTDGDGTKDGADDFPLDPAETLDTDRDGTGDNADTDDDGDGYSDEDEINIHHTNPKRADSDGDGLSDPAELETHHTDPNLADTDNDGLRDGEEFTTYHTNPLVSDTDLDGFLDGYEVLTGKSPLDIGDHPALVADARTAIEFTFPAAIGKTYRIEASTDLSTWQSVETGISGAGGQVQRFYSTRGLPKRYFRVEEDVP
ncbi:MAG: hypothetical protein K9M97_11530, partial [Akkermansiaceae bacterium]|nr:hypothetical protein [Akkermansiaceae bacterium]